ncbi:MAG TPA: cob(I)yrinic acid a,c-diamide adenosyltransferase [Oscillospiraceae bacterium]|nr:cob(I)yrinic acid a,c-diamide adenosyltransferase [Oscillospiraceae bacterium]HPF55624.1 cob(I)yrinic acid a,c-diamide adenosyltransferase [Clostridiales bacterium]HPK34191.1 cob(I)yrinic acid a,c-diamide adenosyltransferase [Oscillospiraceae bacterium]HPR74906.1 cob(I)yrinic acid a,c-diamide adenosyltransferase [Oscillospiraceae bacterium]
MENKIILYYGGTHAMDAAVRGIADAYSMVGKKILYTDFSNIGKYITFRDGDNPKLRVYQPPHPTNQNYAEMTEEKRRYTLLDNTDYFEAATNKAAFGGFDLVIFDYISDATAFGVLYEGILLDWLSGRPEHLDVLATGNFASAKMADLADEIYNFTRIK